MAPLETCIPCHLREEPSDGLGWHSDDKGPKAMQSVRKHTSMITYLRVQHTCVHAIIHLEMAQDNLWEWILSLHYQGAE